MIGAREVYLVRHGETQFNRDGRYQGRSDSPLTALGRQQARRAGQVLGEMLGTTSVQLRSSPLGRAVQTAEIIMELVAGARNLQPDDRLSEIGMGTWEGLTRAEVRSGWPEARKDRPGRNWIFAGPGSEPITDAMARLSRVLDDLAGAPGDEPLIFVSHANAGRLLRGLHMGLSGEEAMCLDAPQEAVFQLCPGGEVCRVDTAPEAYQGFQP